MAPPIQGQIDLPGHLFNLVFGSQRRRSGDTEEEEEEGKVGARTGSLAHSQSDLRWAGAIWRMVLGRPDCTYMQLVNMGDETASTFTFARIYENVGWWN